MAKKTMVHKCTTMQKLYHILQLLFSV